MESVTMPKLPAASNGKRQAILDEHRQQSKHSQLCAGARRSVRRTQRPMVEAEVPLGPVSGSIWLSHRC